jgi:hypothetical protein
MGRLTEAYSDRRAGVRVNADTYMLCESAGREEDNRVIDIKDVYHNMNGCGGFVKIFIRTNRDTLLYPNRTP